MVHKILTRTIIGGVLSVLSIASYAAPVTWVLTDVTFGTQGQGGAPYPGTASGSFRYDADTNTYDNVNITTTGEVGAIWGTGACGDLTLCDTYTRATAIYLALDATALQVTSTASDPSDWTGYYGASLQFVTGLTNAGGTVLLDIASPTDGEGICIDADCLTSGAAGVSAFRAFSGGSVSAVPLPAAAWLFGSALLGLGAVKRKKA